MAKQHPRIHTTDKRTVISRVLKQKNEAGVLTVVNVTSLTVEFKMVNKATGTEVVAATSATKDDAGTGKVSFTLTTASVANPGIFSYYFIVTDGSSRTDHFPAELGDDLLYIDSDTQTAEDAYEAALP